MQGKGVTPQNAPNGHIPLIESFIDENGHPIINADMFKRYLFARLVAASTLNGNQDQLNSLALKLDSLFQTADFAEFQQAKAEREAMLKKIKYWYNDGVIDKSTYHSNCLEVERIYKAAFDNVYNKNIIKAKQFNRLLAHAVDPKKDPGATIKKITRRADELRAKEVRPILHNTYQAKDLIVTSTHVPEGWLTNEQKKLFKEVHCEEAPENRPHTSPSTIRDKRQVGQANALRTEITVDGKQAFVGHRHGSPSVLKMNNDAERQHRTLQNVKQTLTLAANELMEKLADNENPPDPLVVDIASMSLLSPLMQGDLLDPMKQFRQVDDSRLAYWSLHGRAIPLEVKDKEGVTRTIKVQLNSSFMSVGVNAVRGVGTPGARQLVQRVNNRGLDSFVDNFSKQFGGIVDPQLHRICNRIAELESVKEVQDNKQLIQDFNRENLHTAYEKLELCNRALSDPDHKAMVDVKKVKKERSTALKVIEKEEAKLDKLYEKVNIARERAYKDRVNDLKNILVDTKLNGNYARNKDFQKLQMFIDAMDIYYNQPQPGIKRFLDVRAKTSERNKLIKKMSKENTWVKREALREQVESLQSEIDFLNKSNYRFQARFAMLANYSGQFVEWFCKSGEDRTGLLNEHIEAFCIFIEKYGYAPNWDNKDDHEKFHELMPLVHNGAPNRETNSYNDDSPGLKVSDPDFEMPTVSYYTDKKMANISKTATNIGLTLGEKVKQFFKNLVGIDTLPRSIRVAQERIDRLANSRPPEVEVPKMKTPVEKVLNEHEHTLVRSNSYTPGALHTSSMGLDASSTKDKPNKENVKPKKDRPQSSKF